VGTSHILLNARSTRSLNLGPLKEETEKKKGGKGRGSRHHCAHSDSGIGSGEGGRGGSDTAHALILSVVPLSPSPPRNEQECAQQGGVCLQASVLANILDIMAGVGSPDDTHPVAAVAGGPILRRMVWPPRAHAPAHRESRWIRKAGLPKAKSVTQVRYTVLPPLWPPDLHRAVMVLCARSGSDSGQGRTLWYPLGAQE